MPAVRGRLRWRGPVFGWKSLRVLTAALTFGRAAQVGKLEGSHLPPPISQTRSNDGFTCSERAKRTTNGSLRLPGKRVKSIGVLSFEFASRWVGIGVVRDPTRNSKLSPLLQSLSPAPPSGSSLLPRPIPLTDPAHLLHWINTRMIRKGGNPSRVNHPAGLCGASQARHACG